MDPTNKFEKILQLANRSCESKLQPEEAAQLEALLRDDPAAQQAWMLLVEQDMLLTWLASSGLAAESDSQSLSADVNLEISSQKEAFSGAVPPSSVPLPTSRSPVLGFLNHTTSVLSKPVFWSILGAGIAFFGYVAVITWGIRDRRQHLAESEFQNLKSEIDSVATITYADEKSRLDTTFKHKIHSGEPLKIDSGVVELKLTQGATLVVEGPAQWIINGDNHATLKRGKLVAKVPKSAIGFTLDTPTSQIVDLGTEFAAEVVQPNRTQIHVLQGAVALHVGPNGKPLGDAEEVIELRAGNARQIELDASGLVATTHAIPSDPQRFVREGTAKDPRQLYVNGVLASSEYWEVRGAQNLVNNRGLAHGRHTNVSEGAMWHSFDGDVKNVYLIFDLGRPCQLESMKVWNYNEQRLDNYKYLGLKSADIFVADSARFDPATHPGAWRLISANQTFSMASGKADYSTPDVVQLGNCEARFVAVVVKEHFGNHPPGPLATHDCVGLSEVQFLGEPVVRPVPDQNKK